VNVLPAAKVDIPYLGPLALHFLRSKRSVVDSLDASEQNIFSKTLSFVHTGNGSLPNRAIANDSNISTEMVEVPYGVTTNVSIAVRNTGDLTIHDCTIMVSPRLESALGINGLNPSAISSPSIPQTLFSSLVPMGIVGASSFT
jgi:hypothetical protein